MYQPFLISGFKTAKSIGMKPWLSPPDAFPTLENMHVNKGVLEKRLGFSPFAQMKHGDDLQTTTAITGIHTFLDKSMPCLLLMDSKGVVGDYTGRCNFYNPIDGTTEDISSGLADTVIGSDLNEYRCIAAHVSAAATRPVTGVNYLTVWVATGNTGAVETWVTATNYIVPIFTGSPYDFFSFCNWQSVGYMVNNVNQIHQWTGRGGAFAPFDTKIDADDPAVNQINTCRFIFVKDDRLCFLDTVERGDWCPVRFRYSPVLQTDFSAAGSGYVDAPKSGDRVCAAGYVGKNIAVFTQGGDVGTLWQVKSSGITDVPFKWDKITTTELIRSPYSGVEMKDGLAAVGATNIVFFDGFKIKDLDIPNIRDILDEFNDVFIRSVFGYRQRDKRHLLLTFADKDSSNIDRILDYNINENNWTIHKSIQTFFVNYIGGSTGQKVPIGAEFAGVLADDLALIDDITLDARTVYGTPKPYTLIGCRNSQVYKWNDGEYDGTDDDDGKIAVKAESIELNPFIKEGLKVACEKIGFLVDNDSNASFRVDVFKNTSSESYKHKTISCDSPDDNVDMFWAWIFCDGEIGNFHRLEITHTEKGNTPKIHAFKPYFDSAGALDL